MKAVGRWVMVGGGCTCGTNGAWPVSWHPVGAAVGGWVSSWEQACTARHLQGIVCYVTSAICVKTICFVLRSSAGASQRAAMGAQPNQSRLRGAQIGSARNGGMSHAAHLGEVAGWDRDQVRRQFRALCGCSCRALRQGAGWGCQACCLPTSKLSPVPADVHSGCHQQQALQASKACRQQLVGDACSWRAARRNAVALCHAAHVTHHHCCCSVLVGSPAPLLAVPAPRASPAKHPESSQPECRAPVVLQCPASKPRHRSCAAMRRCVVWCGVVWRGVVWCGWRVQVHEHTDRPSPVLQAAAEKVAIRPPLPPVFEGGIAAGEPARCAVQALPLPPAGHRQGRAAAAAAQHKAHSGAAAVRDVRACPAASPLAAPPRRLQCGAGLPGSRLSAAVPTPP